MLLFDAPLGSFGTMQSELWSLVHARADLGGSSFQMRAWLGILQLYVVSEKKRH